MSRYLIDTGPLTALLLGRESAVELMIPWIGHRETTTSAMVYAEAFEYIRPRPNFVALHSALQNLLGGIQPYFLTYGILERYAQIRLNLRPPYGPGLIGDIDTLIAATGLEYGLLVVTLDSDFLRVPELGVILLDQSSFSVIEQREPAQ